MTKYIVFGASEPSFVRLLLISENCFWLSEVNGGVVEEQLIQKMFILSQRTWSHGQVRGEASTVGEFGRTVMTLIK